MVKKCDICDEEYVEVDEDICVGCAIEIEVDNEAFDRYLLSEDRRKISEDELNDKGVSVEWID